MDFEQEAHRATTSAEGQKDRQRINVLFLCDEWKSSKGGLSTFNREFAVNLAKTSSDSIKVHCYVCQSDELDREDARNQGVNLITAQSIPGSSDASLDCLKFPPSELPHPDIVIGHGRKFGTPANFITRATKCKWMHFVHVFCEDLGKYKLTESGAEDAIELNEKKHKSEIELCKAADVVVGVGKRLQSKYQKCLANTKVHVRVLTPGIFETFSNLNHLSVLRECSEEDSPMEEEFSVFVFGRVTFKDLFVKGYNIIANAIASLGESFKLTIVGAPPGKLQKIEKWFLEKTNISRDQLTIRGYICDQEELKGMFCEAHLIALPSHAEGFGLVALEAISAGIPVLISRQSGISTALKKVKDGHSVIVTSQEPVEWAKRIRMLSHQTRQERSDNAIRLRENYGKTYPWNTECEKFITIITNLLEAKAELNKENIDRLSKEVHNSNGTVNHGKVKRPLSVTEQTGVKIRRLENCDATKLQNQVWRHLGQLFGFRPQTESHLKWGDVSLEKDPTTGNEWLECSSKMRRTFQPVAQVSTDTTYQCPVNIYKEFSSHRPEEMNKLDSPFYLAVKHKRKPDSNVWYMKIPLGVNKIGKNN